MRRMLFSVTFAIAALALGCQSSPPSAQGTSAAEAKPSLFSQLFGSKEPSKPKVALGPNGMPLGEKTKQDAAIESVMKRGGSVVVEYMGMRKFVAVADLHGFHNAAAALESLGPLTKLRDINLHDTSFNDADLVLLRGLLNLRNINLSATKVSDAGLPVLLTLPNLNTLSLNETRVTDAGLETLHRMNLAELSLYGTKVSDKGLAQLRDMQTLHKLVLGGSSSITNRGLYTLGEMNQLRELTILSSGATNSAIEDLKIASSQLKIVH